MLKEFYSYADIIGNKLTTTANGKSLETGGMIHIRALADKQPVSLKAGTSLDLKMPAPAFDPSMQLFLAEEQASSNASVIVGQDSAASNQAALNWTAYGQQQFFFDEKKKIITLFNSTDNPYEVYNNKKGTKTMARFRIPFDASISTEAMKLLLEKKYGRYYDKIKVKRQWGSIFKREKEKDVTKGEWYKTHYVGDSILISLSLATRLKLITREDSLGYEVLFRKKMEDAIKQKKAYSEFLEKKEQYSFKIGSLGWINCDRFTNYPDSRLTDFVLNPGNGFEDGYFTAILIFEKEKAAMPGYWSQGKVTFPNIPLGHKVNIVCTGVKEGKMYTAVQAATIAKKEMPQLNFIASTPEEFRQQLEKFGNVKSRNQ